MDTDALASSTTTKNYVYAAPSSANGTPSFRKLVAADIPSLAASKITSGTLSVARGGTGQTSVDTTPTSGSSKMCTSDGIYTAIDALKTSVSEGKSLIATAVTDKGVQTAVDASFSTIASNIGAIPSGSKVAVGIVEPSSTPFDISCGFKPSKLMFFICPNPKFPDSTVYQYAGGNLLLTCYWDGTSTIGLYIIGDSSYSTYYFYPYSSYNQQITISTNSTGCTVNSSSRYGPWPYHGGTPYQWVAWT